VFAVVLLLEEFARWAGILDNSFLSKIVLDSFDEIDGFRFAMYAGLTVFTIVGALYIAIDRKS